MTGTPAEGSCSISRSPDVIYFAAGTKSGQHVSFKKLFLESVLHSAAVSFRVAAVVPIL